MFVRLAFDGRLASHVYYSFVVGRVIADRIGVGRVTGQQVRLAATSACVDGFFLATAARFLHPAETAKAVERITVVPDLADRALLNVREGQAGQRTSRVTGQRGTVRGYAEEHRAPAVHAAFGPVFEVVRHDEVDLAAIADLASIAFHNRLGFLQLLRGRHQLRAVGMRPAVVLRVREFEIFGA